MDEAQPCGLRAAPPRVRGGVNFHLRNFDRVQVDVHLFAKSGSQWQRDNMYLILLCSEETRRP